MRTTVFVASSHESVHIALAIKKALQDCAEVNVWDQSFELSVPIIEGLFRNLRIADFAIFVLWPDDFLKMRGREMVTSRDNVIFELGFFMGRMGVERAFFLVPRNLSPEKEFRLPSDLQGLVYSTFDPEESAEQAVQEACRQIRRQIERLSVRHLYHIANNHSGKCLDVEAWRRRPGAKIVQYSYHGGANQLWRLERADDPFYYVQSEHSALYLTAGDPTVGASVEQQDLHKSDYQQWEFVRLPGEAYRITPRFNDELCLAVEAGSNEDGAAVVIAHWKHESACQWWLNIKAVLG